MTKRRFWIKLGIFLAPVALYLASTAGLGFRAGEFTALSEVARLQSGEEEVLYGRAYRDNYFAFKLISTKFRKPELLVLGSSRSMQFRASLANQAPERFYNAGGAVQSAFEIRPFLRELESAGALPGVLVLGLDQPWFNGTVSTGSSLRRIISQMDEEAVTPMNRCLAVSRSIFSDLLTGKVRPGRILSGRDPLFGNRAIGVSALMRGRGFRPDGSYRYDFLKAPPPTDRRLEDGCRLLREGTGHFAPGNTVYAAALREIDSVLAFCAGKGIVVAGFAPPYAPSLRREMDSGGRHSHLRASADSLIRLFQTRGFVFRDFGDAASVDGGDEDMIDAFHGSEYVYLQIYRGLLDAAPTALGRFSDPATLAAVAARPRSARLLAFGRAP